MSSDAFENFCFSYSSLAKPLTTRIALTFSSTDSLRLSYFLNTFLNAGIANFAISKSPKIKIGTTITKVNANFPPIINDIMIEKINIKGERIAVLITIKKDI